MKRTIVAALAALLLAGCGYQGLSERDLLQIEFMGSIWEEWPPEIRREACRQWIDGEMADAEVSQRALAAFYGERCQP